MKFTYTTSGVCSRSIDIEIENDIIKNVVFHGGCNGNAKGLAKLAIGQSPKAVADKLSGILCGAKGTSCPDQLSKALYGFLNKT